MIKMFYKEMIIVGLVVALLASFRSCDSKSYGSTFTECYIDTVVYAIPSATVVRYEKKLVPVFLPIPDPSLKKEGRTDTVWSFDTDTLISIINDTAYLYADIPVQEYKDSSYYIRTIGWLDSLVIFDKLPKFDKSSDHYIMAQYSRNSYGLGYAITGHRWMGGVTYDIRNRSYGVTIGWKLNRPKLLINK